MSSLKTMEFKKASAGEGKFKRQAGKNLKRKACASAEQAFKKDLLQ